MCGIAAAYGSNGAEPGERMLARLTHRGPDDSDHRRIGDGAWLGHTRLSIVDLDGGRQPLGAPDGWALVCNGEIYNHERIRDRIGAGTFTTHSDNEAALHLLRTAGPDALGALRGMWALCAAAPAGPGGAAASDGSASPDGPARPDGLVGGRDPHALGFVAARDPIGIKPLYWARRSDGAVFFASEIRAFDRDLQPDVEAFPPGCYWTPRTGLVRFADPVPAGDAAPDWADLPAEKAEAATREVLVDSVRRHLMADVEVGVFLSGGLDSSLVAAIAAREVAEHGGRLSTFSVGTAGSPDLLAAREVAAYLGTDHREAVFDAAQAAAALDQVIGAVESFDPGLIRSSVPNWFLAELASRHVKVVLTGEGSDELFAGYDYYHRDHADPRALHAELTRTIGQLHGLNLQRCDRTTMAHGLEARVPFLDADVIEHAMALPPRLKTMEHGMEKTHLRRAFDGWLPEHLLWRRKSAFGTGSGAQDVLGPHWEARFTDAEFAAARDTVTPPLRTKEELGYYTIFRRALPGVDPEAVLTRFATA